MLQLRELEKTLRIWLIGWNMDMKKVARGGQIRSAIWFNVYGEIQWLREMACQCGFVI